MCSSVGEVYEMGYLDSSVNIKDREYGWIQWRQIKERRQRMNVREMEATMLIGGTRPTNAAHMPNRAYLRKLQLQCGNASGYDSWCLYGERVC